MENIENYKKTIKQFAETKTNYSFQTIGEDYALIVLERIILSAKKTFKYTTNSFFDESIEKDMVFIEALCAFLSAPEAQVQIIITDLPEDISQKDALNPFYRLYQHEAYKQGRISIKNSSGGHFVNNDKKVNFCVADSLMYRFESDTSKRIAFCNFNDSIRSEKYENVFDDVFVKIQTAVDLNSIFAE